MLNLISEPNAIRELQIRMEDQLKAGLEDVGEQPVSFRPTKINLQMFISGDHGIWWGTKELDNSSGEPRFWNAFGLYRPGKVQRIAVEINIPTQRATGLVAGFFASDALTGKTFLLHSGKVGGGLEGATKQGFLDWLGRDLVEVSVADGLVREGIIIGDLDSDIFSHQVARFVREADAFKASLDDD